MFRSAIRNTPLTSEVAHSLFPNIKAEPPFEDDVSFLATLRALLHNRIPKDESALLLTREVFVSHAQLSRDTSEMLVRRCLSCYAEDELSGKGNIMLLDLSVTSDDAPVCIRAFLENFSNLYHGWQRLEKINAFFQGAFVADCYINPTEKSVLLLCHNLDLKKYHYLQVATLAFLPWYFDPEQGISQQEMSLLQALRQTSSSEYIEQINKIASLFDFRSAHIRNTLNGFEIRYEREELARVNGWISECDRTIDRYNRAIGDQLSAKRDHMIRALGLQAKIDGYGEEDSELMEYFLCNKKLHLERVVDSRMHFACSDYLSYFDREVADRAISNTRSFVYRRNDDHGEIGISNADMKVLLHEIFVNEEPRLRIKFCAAYNFDIRRNVQADTSHAFDSNLSDCMPNPHIDRHACIGDYERVINDALRQGNYVTAIEQCVASCKSLNWGDGPVMSEFMDTMWGKNRKNNRCIELPDGTVVGPKGAVEWLKAQEAEHVQETEETTNE